MFFAVETSSFAIDTSIVCMWHLQVGPLRVVLWVFDHWVCLNMWYPHQIVI